MVACKYIVWIQEKTTLNKHVNNAKSSGALKSDPMRSGNTKIAIYIAKAAVIKKDDNKMQKSCVNGKFFLILLLKRHILIL